jgi:hypothetical protein
MYFSFPEASQRPALISANPVASSSPALLPVDSRFSLFQTTALSVVDNGRASLKRLSDWREPIATLVLRNFELRPTSPFSHAREHFSSFSHTRAHSRTFRSLMPAHILVLSPQSLLRYQWSNPKRVLVEGRSHTLSLSPIISGRVRETRSAFPMLCQGRGSSGSRRRNLAWTSAIKLWNRLPVWVVETLENLAVPLRCFAQDITSQCIANLLL